MEEEGWNGGTKSWLPGTQGSVALEILLCFEEGVSFPDSEDLKIYSVL